MVKYLQTIKEEEEHDGDANQFDMMMMSPAPGGGLSPDKRRTSSKKAGRTGGSFIGGSFIGGEEPAAAPESEDQKAEREKKEFKDSF